MEAMNDDELLNTFFDRVEEIVSSQPDSEWDTLIRQAFPASLQWDGYVGSMVEILCGGDARHD